MLGVPTDAKRILIINVKGGCGKTTVATNLASFYATQGFPTALLDYDSQNSSSHWLKIRGNGQSRIFGIAAHMKPEVGMTRTFQMRLPMDTQRIIIDAPGGVSKHQLPELLRGVDTVLIPVLPSPIDMHAVSQFLDDLRDTIRLRCLNVRIGLVLNRLRMQNNSSSILERFAKELGFPLVARLKDTQHYIRATTEGLGIHELEGNQAKRDKAQWRSLVGWIEGEPLAETATGTV